MVKSVTMVRSWSSVRLEPRVTARLTCGMTTWIWTHCSKRGLDWTTQIQLSHRGVKFKPGSVGTTASSPKTTATKPAQRGWAQSAACLTPAAVAPPESSVASAAKMESQCKFTAPTGSNLLMGRWLAPFSGTTPVHCARPLATMRTHDATVHRPGSRRTKARRFNTSFGEHYDKDAESVTRLFSLCSNRRLGFVITLECCLFLLQITTVFVVLCLLKSFHWQWNVLSQIIIKRNSRPPTMC